MNFGGVVSANIPAYWSYVEPLIKRAVDSGQDHTLGEVFDSLLTCDRQLWVAGDEEIKAILITRLVAETCYVELCAGDGVIKFFKENLKVVEDWAKQAGCKKVEIWGRPGWQRVLDYDFKNIVLKKDLQ